MAKQYKDDEIVVITNDLLRLRNRPSMYIGFLGSAGVMHLCKEIIDNNRDECFKKESPGDTIDIYITDDYIISSDNGRGIPTNMLRTVHETNQAGSNMTRDHGNTAGENGTGTTTYTALASDLIVTTFRPTEKKKLTIHYKEGKLVEELLEDYGGKESGMTTRFAPSKKILGENEIPVEQLTAWLKDFSYTLPEGIHMKYQYKKEDVVRIVHKPIQSYFDTMIKTEERLCSPVTISASGDLTELVQDKKYARHFDVEVSFVYASDAYKGEDVRKSWMNMIWTMNGGTHVNGCINGLSKYLIDKIRSKSKKYENEDLKKDVLSNLSVVVKCNCNMANMFDSQAKSRVFSKPLGDAIEKAVYEKLGDVYEQAKIETLCDVVIQNNRVRKEGEKARNINSATKAIKSWTKPDSFIPCSSAKCSTPKELFLVEGNSAGGGLRNARNAMFQAILMFRGKCLSVYDQEVDRVLKSEPWLNLVKVLGCGIGPTFDIKKLNYDKIIISTDADIDGYHIRVGFMTFFGKFMPEIIKAGKLYIAEPPLYKLVKGKEVVYVASQTERIEECIRSVEKIKISFPEMKNK